MERTVIITAVTLCLLGVAAAQVDTAWVRYYNGVGSGQDMACALEADGSGGVYVTGLSLGATTAWDYATIRYNAAGETVWVRRFVGPFDDQPTAMALDSFGNVIVTGSTGINETLTNYCTVKYSASGGMLWSRTFSGVPDFGATALAVGTDPDGNVYVTGQGRRPDWNVDMVTMKYSPAGDTLWTRWLDGPGHSRDVPAAIAVTGSAVYVAGTSYDEYVTVKYTPAGETAWARFYHGPGYGGNARAIAVDGEGSVFVTGQDYGIGTSDDWVTLKYDAAGTLLWTARLDGPASLGDRAKAIAVDAAGNAHVTGFCTGSGTRSDFVTAKYGPDGDTLWVRSYNDPDSGYDNAYALALDSLGNCYATGATEGATASDYLTVRYNANGDIAWMRRQAAPTGGAAEAAAVAVDAAGGVYVTGYCWGAGQDFMTVKYVQTPAVQETDERWHRLEHRGPTIARGILNLTSAFCNLQSDYVLLDATGHKLLALRPGPNDVSRLAPGVYFVSGPSVRKCVINR